MSFKEFSLDPRILAGVESAGFTIPTPVQQQAIPVVLQGGDLLGLAQTGTGKTAAFLLPIFQRLIQQPTRRVRALILAPTRELAEQIHQASVQLGKHTGVRSVAIYGGVSKGPQLAALHQGPEIVVACPGRLLDHLGEGDIDLSHVEVLVLDEADTMCDMGFLPATRRVLQRLPTRRQTLFFSATMPEEIRELSRNILSTPVTVRINANAPADTVSHALYPVPEALKRKLLLALLQQTATGKVLIFTRTKHRARSLARELETHDYRVTQLQGNLSQNRRQSAMEGFREGKYDLLVATDIAAHGIDVSEVSHVINFDIPDTVDAYTHRIGRTGRALHTGEAFTLATPDDVATVRAVERTLNVRIERRALARFDYGGFSPEDQFPEQTPKHPRQGQLQPNSSGNRPPQARPLQHSNVGNAPRLNGPGSSGNRPPQARPLQHSNVGNAPRLNGPGSSGNRPPQARPLQHSNVGNAPRLNGPGSSGNRPPQARPLQHSNVGNAPRLNGPGSSGNRPPQARPLQHSDVGNAPRLNGPGSSGNRPPQARPLQHSNVGNAPRLNGPGSSGNRPPQARPLQHSNVGNAPRLNGPGSSGNRPPQARPLQHSNVGDAPRLNGPGSSGNRPPQARPLQHSNVGDAPRLNGPGSSGNRPPQARPLQHSNVGDAPRLNGPGSSGNRPPQARPLQHSNVGNAPRLNGPGSPGNRPPQARPLQHSNVGNAPRVNGPGSPGNRPPQARPVQQGAISNAPRRSDRPAASTSHGGPNRSTGPGKNSAAARNSGGPRTVSGAEDNRYPKSQRFVTSRFPSR